MLNSDILLHGFSVVSNKENMKVSKVSEFYSVNESSKPAGKRVHHNNGSCRPGQDIPAHERRSGTSGYRLCDDCKKLNDQGR